MVYSTFGSVTLIKGIFILGYNLARHQYVSELLGNVDLKVTEVTWGDRA
jgi:hypothetical protein